MCNSINSETIEVFIDESGTMTANGNSRYFIIAMLFTKSAAKLRHCFKDRISFLMKRKQSFENMIKNSKEIKGSDISETKKKILYEYTLQRVTDEEVELGLIVLDNQNAEERFFVNHARAFNFMLQSYFDKHFREHSKFMCGSGNIKLILDEQNIPVDEKDTLKIYLNSHFIICNPICDEFVVNYVNSKDEKLVQFADWIANTFYRYFEKSDTESEKNIDTWTRFLCNKSIFEFLPK